MAVSDWSSAGSATTLALPAGTSSGDWVFEGSAVGVTTRSGTAGGTWSYTGAAVGAVPPGVVSPWSTAVSATTLAAPGAPVITVTTVPSGESGGTWTFTGAAVGDAPAPITTPVGTAAGSWTFTGAAAGKRSPKSSATGAWVFTGAAVGKCSPKGTAAGTWLFTGEVGSKKDGTATGTWTFTGVAVGARPSDPPVPGRGLSDTVTPPRLIFIPPTAYVRPMAVNPRHPGYSLFKHYRPIEAGINVWLVDGRVTTSEPADPTARVFLGGHHNVVTEAEAAVLTAAGYTVVEV